MSRIAVLGAGAGGRSAAVELSRAGHTVRLWNRNPQTLAPVLAIGAIVHTGVLGDGEVVPELMSTSLADTLAGVDAAVVCLPALAHTALFRDLCDTDDLPPVVLNPGQTGGALHARAVFAEHGRAAPPVAELSTLTYVARVSADGASLNVSGRARVVRCGCLPGHDAAQKWALELFPGVDPVADVMASSLANVNLALHAPGAVLSAAWMEATGGDFRFYVDAMTPGVARVLERLDGERRAVGAAYGHDLPPLVEEMAAIGTADAQAAARHDVVAAIRNSSANERIMAPGSYAHRYYREDLGYSLAALAAFADIAGVPVPTAQALLDLGRTAADLAPDYGLSPRSLGIDGLTFDQLCRVVRG